jgi:hypothetical protein
MTRQLAAVAAVLTAVCVTSLCGVAAGSTFLSARAAKHALRVNLARGYGIRHVRAICRRRSPVKLSCRWSGRRGDSTYRGRATVERAGHSITVQLTNVH